MSDLRFKLCPKCKRLKPVGNGSTLCSECADKAKKARKEARKRDFSAEYDARKASEDPKYRSFYRSKEWRMVSRHYAQSVGYRSEECDESCPKRGSCAGWGADVHHVVPIQTPEGWARRFDETNLKMLCVHMHNRAHGRTFSNGWEGGHAGRTAEEAARDADGPPHEGREGGQGDGGGGLKVSDYRM